MTEKRYYMACLDLTGRECLVVGGGSIGREKAEGLLDCGARVTVVAPEADSVLQAPPYRWLARRYEEADLDGVFLVIAATSDEQVNRAVFADAEARGLICNVVDVPELCSFILPAMLRRDPIAVGISTGGASPVLAQRLREQIAEVVREEHAELARDLRAMRPWVKATFPTYEERRDFFRERVAEALA